MINVPHYKAAIAALPGESIVVPRNQINELLAELEIGQAARHALTSIKTITAIAAGTAGATA